MCRRNGENCGVPLERARFRKNDNNTTLLYARHFNKTKYMFVGPVVNYDIIKLKGKFIERNLREELEILK